MKIFYSWQSDKHIPNNLNRSFIEKALENAAKSIRNDNSIEVIPVIDRDTIGFSGSPNIPQTILQKIDEADVFVCDITIINSNSKFRPTPNPNVLFELGYAVQKLGWDRIVMVMNESFGNVNKLPFDLEKRRTFLYSLTASVVDKVPSRVNLEKRIESALRLIAEKNNFKVESKHILKPSFQIQRQYMMGALDEIYDLRMRVKNEGSKKIEDYRIDIEFPNDFLNQHTGYFVEVAERRTETHRLFRILPTHKSNTVLFPGDEMDAFGIDYLVNDKLRKSESMKQKLKISIYAEDDFVWTVEREMSEIINKNSIEPERKLDETIPGGRYIQDGKFVNAWGEEIE